MKKPKIKISLSLAVIAMLAWVAGCATMSDVLIAKDEGKGTTQVYPVSADQAWEIAITVFRWEGADAIEQHRSEGYMLTSSHADGITPTAGAFMGAWIESIDQGTTKVTVVTKRRVATNIATTLTETTFHKRFAQAVERIKKGERLPSKPPE